MWLLYASASAVCFGMRGILYQWVSQKQLNRSLLLLGVYLCGMIVALTAALVLGQSWSGGIWFGVLMGIFSCTSNSAMYKGFEVGKASLVAVITALPPVVVTLIALLIWNERFHAGGWIAFAMIMCGVVLIRYAGGYTVRDLRGVQWAVLALFAFGITDVSSKAATRMGGATFPTLTVMYGIGSILFMTAWLLSERRQRRLTQPPAHGSQPSAASGNAAAESAAALEFVLSSSRLRTLGLGLLIGTSNITGMILIMSAFRLGVTGLVSAVIAMNVLLILLYARVVLKETFTMKEWTGMALAIGGIIVLKLAG